jgi:hypothetical protein
MDNLIEEDKKFELENHVEPDYDRVDDSRPYMIIKKLSVFASSPLWICIKKFYPDVKEV